MAGDLVATELGVGRIFVVQRSSALKCFSRCAALRNAIAFWPLSACRAHLTFVLVSFCGRQNFRARRLTAPIHSRVRLEMTARSYSELLAASMYHLRPSGVRVSISNCNQTPG
jgi:hypothetical protein